MRALVLLLTAVVLVARGGSAQSSQFSVRGLGLPGRGLSVQSAGMAGSSALFDPLSSLNPASLSGFPAMTAAFSITPEWRHWDGTEGTASLRDIRFPHFLLGGPLARTPLAMAVGVSSYADHDFALASQDTVLLRGVAIPVTDTLTSTGGLNDIRIALAYSASRKWSVGGSVHVITGSNRLVAQRVYADTNYETTRRTSELAYEGIGFSLGTMGQLGRRLSVAFMVRSDGKATVDRDSTRIYSVDLPYTFSAGVLVRPSTKLTVTAQGIYRTWSGANSDLQAAGAIGSVNTLDLSAGFELTPDPRRATHRVWRIGAHYADLPFPLVVGAKPKEFSITGGTGAGFARGRARIDLALEHAWRHDGAGNKERALILTLGLTVRP